MVRRKLIAFDLDGTLAPSKSALPDRMGTVLGNLLDKYEVLVISGGKFAQFEKQLLMNLKVETEKLSRLHLMPTCGTRYLGFKSGKWELVYVEDFTEAEKAKIIKILDKAVDQLGMREPKIYGETIEDRDSQITFSALGQDIVEQLGGRGVELKEAWDRDNKKKDALRDELAKMLPDFEVRVGGTTSIDITKPGIDKAYGIQKIMDALELKKKDILFIGDRLAPGGNDYPVTEFGVDCIEISDWQETALVVEAICQTS